MGWLVFFLLVVVGIVWAILAAILAAIRRREALQNYFREQGFRSRGSELTASLRPPANVWLPQIKISECYTGMRNDFEVAVFRSSVPQGEALLVQTMVAVRRPPKHDVRLNNFMARLVTIDATSTPGWVIAAVRGSTIRIPLLETLLTALTARDGDEPGMVELASAIQLYDS